MLHARYSSFDLFTHASPFNSFTSFFFTCFSQSFSFFLYSFAFWTLLSISLFILLFPSHPPVPFFFFLASRSFFHSFASLTPTRPVRSSFCNLDSILSSLTSKAIFSLARFSVVWRGGYVFFLCGLSQSTIQLFDLCVLSPFTFFWPVFEVWLLSDATCDDNIKMMRCWKNETTKFVVIWKIAISIVRGLFFCRMRGFFGRNGYELITITRTPTTRTMPSTASHRDSHHIFDKNCYCIIVHSRK